MMSTSARNCVRADPSDTAHRLTCTFPGKEKKRVKKAAETASVAPSIDPEELRAAIAKIREEEVPDSSQGREQYFMTQVGIGEQLCAQGASTIPSSFMQAIHTAITAIRSGIHPSGCARVLQSTACLSIAGGAYHDIPTDSPRRSVQGDCSVLHYKLHALTTVLRLLSR